ncbi:lipocalin-like domain-containing protein [Rhizobium viscosum]|uniref:Lipocalin-like domain-containing protein n=1 Tax=Rhizobium viscosum TaxID=1673 RepID=A0ABR9IVR9_RHIVS|nr:lipocalin-like domain-containing protein [Rhizobium viscosum]MBE1506902.1 hypothetical protein [Rhizobium viscosum]
MKSLIKLVMLALAMAFAAPAFADEASIVGSWRMTSLQFTDANGKVAEVPYSGQVIFSEGGTLSVQAMDANVNAAPTTYTVNGYEAYYGPVEVDDAQKTFAITVESSLARDLIGKRLVRKFEVSSNQLVILPADPAEGWRVTYERR